MLEYHSSRGTPMEGRVMTPKAAQSSCGRGKACLGSGARRKGARRQAPDQKGSSPAPDSRRTSAEGSAPTPPPPPEWLSEDQPTSEAATPRSQLTKPGPKEQLFPPRRALRREMARSCPDSQACALTPLPPLPRPHSSASQSCSGHIRLPAIPGLCQAFCHSELLLSLVKHHLL